MAEILKITTERVDDIPLLLAQLERMGVQLLLDSCKGCFCNPHMQGH